MPALRDRITATAEPASNTKATAIAHPVVSIGTTQSQVASALALAMDGTLAE